MNQPFFSGQAGHLEIIRRAACDEAHAGPSKLPDASAVSQHFAVFHADNFLGATPAVQSVVMWSIDKHVVRPRALDREPLAMVVDGDYH
jgi:hypothetical protein